MGNHQVLYRKYRPYTFNEVVGQEHVVRTLTNALNTNKVAHAYLFTGPRGTGKTTVARLLARHVNCAVLSARRDEATTIQASADSYSNSFSEGGLRYVCSKENACVNCSAFILGNHPDLIEIDAASNRGIDEIRALKEGIRFAPVQAPKKFFIVDEVHMLTKEAFNALLKTLEEPPSHAIFVLATTEIHKVPSTIVSRCQRFDFRRLNMEEIKDRLKNIANNEGVVIDDDALELIAIYADGSQRDAESLLDQTISFSAEGGSAFGGGDSHITRKHAASILGLVEFEVVRSFVENLATKNAAAAISLINESVDRGYDMEQFLKAIIAYLREVLLLAINAEIIEYVAKRIGREQAEAAAAQAKVLSKEKLIIIIERLLEASQQIKYSPSPQLPIEIAVVELLSEKI